MIKSLKAMTIRLCLRNLQLPMPTNFFFVKVIMEIKRHTTGDMLCILYRLVALAIVNTPTITTARVMMAPGSRRSLGTPAIICSW